RLRTIAEICCRLEGIPLAIELAAARVSVLSLEEIALRLDDSLRLLRGTSRARPARHQTLRAAVDWSYDLLSDAERALFRRLSVFAGGFSLEAMESVCTLDGPQALEPDEALDLLARLIDKSLATAQVNVAGT